MPFILTLPEHIKKHGGGFPVEVQSSPKVFLLPSGAGWQCGMIDPTFAEFMFEPAGHPKILHDKRAYHLARLELAESHFQSCRAACLGTAGSEYRWRAALFGPDPGNPKGALLRLRDIAAEHREEIRKLDELIAATPEVQAKMAREAELARSHAASQLAAQAERAELASVQL